MDKSFIFLWWLIFRGEAEIISHEIGVLLVVLLLRQVVINIEIKPVRKIDSFFVDPFLENELDFVADTEGFGGFW